jgi:hypothetical protein
VLARRIEQDDFVEICKWFEMRNMPVPHKSLFSKYGFIVPNIGAGFVYFTTSKVAIIDGYITNPQANDKQRDLALDAITDELIKMSVFRRCNVIKCDTQLDSIKRRAAKFGFKSCGYFESFKLSL